MKPLLIATCVAAGVAGFGWASAQGVDEPLKPPTAASQNNSPAAQIAEPKPASTAPRVPETTGHAPSQSAADNASDEESKSAAEARRVRAAVSRTPERTRELSRSELSRSELSRSASE